MVKTALFFSGGLQYHHNEDILFTDDFTFLIGKFMKFFSKTLDGLKSIFKATKNYYSAWSILGNAFRLKAEAELLDAVNKKMKAGEEYLEFSQRDIEKANEVLKTLSHELRNERIQIISLYIPLLLFICLIYAIFYLLIDLLKVLF